MLYPALITEALSTVRYPGAGKSLTELDMVADDIRIDGNKVSFTLVFDKPTDPFRASIIKAAEAAIKLREPEAEVTINTAVRRGQEAAPKPPVLPGVKNIVAVSSGKGGVGKSTVAANLAVALAAEGYRVGILDADIFGPSLPKWFDRAVWPGAMASNALKQLIEQADWGELDYFLIDMPPGTSDIHLTLVQTLGLTGTVVVTTPQQVALADARKGIAMFRDPKINVPVLGLVDNMAWFTPEKHPDERYYLFGRDEDVDALAKEFDVPVLARIPLVAAVGEHSDNGKPIVTENTASALAFIHLAHEVIEAVDRRNNELPPTQKVDVH